MIMPLELENSIFNLADCFRPKVQKKTAQTAKDELNALRLAWLN